MDGPERGQPRVLVTHAGGDIFVDLPLQVIPQFLLEFVFDLRRQEQRTKPKPQDGGEAHGDSSRQTARTIDEIAVASRSHCAASWSSAFRPALVSV